MSMIKLYNIDADRLPKLFEIIDNSTGKVELVGEGFRLDLKSQLCKYVALANIFSGEDNIVNEMVLEVEDGMSYLELVDFMMGR